MKNLIITLLGILTLSSCNLLHRINFTQVPQSTLPSEMVNGRIYVKDISGGTYVNNPKGIPGHKIYVYNIGDSTYCFASLRTYPKKVVDKVTLNTTPIIRVNGKALITNSNDFGLFLTAFSSQNKINTEQSANLVITDYNESVIDNQLIQDSIKAIRLNDTTEFLQNSEGQIIYPNEILYVIGADITTIAMTLGNKITDASEVSASIFKMDNNYYTEGITYTFDYKIGLTYSIIYREMEIPSKSRKPIKDLQDISKVKLKLDDIIKSKEQKEMFQKRQDQLKEKLKAL